jgi:hypothetical protein
VGDEEVLWLIVALLRQIKQLLWVVTFMLSIAGIAFGLYLTTS